MQTEKTTLLLRPRPPQQLTFIHRPEATSHACHPGHLKPPPCLPGDPRGTGSSPPCAQPPQGHPTAERDAPRCPRDTGAEQDEAGAGRAVPLRWLSRRLRALGPLLINNNVRISSNVPAAALCPASPSPTAHQPASGALGRGGVCSSWQWFNWEPAFVKLGGKGCVSLGDGFG